MANKGGEPGDALLTLEEALKRFVRKESRDEQKTERTTQKSNVRYADFSQSGKQEAPQSSSRGTRPLTASERLDFFGHPLNQAPKPAATPEQVIAVLDGVPRSLADLQKLEAAEFAYRRDFENADDDLDDDASDGLPAAEIPQRRRSYFAETAYTVMGAALMVLVALLMTRAPGVKRQRNQMAARVMPSPALKASQGVGSDDSITTFVVISDSDLDHAQPAPVAKVTPKPAVLEARIKDSLKVSAFTDIGVSVGKMGEAFLAGEVYSIEEAQKVARIVRRVAGVRAVHFLHPDVRVAEGPAYFGAITAWAPDVWGAKVQAVVIGSPADKAGLHPNDIISEFDGNTIYDADYFNYLIAKYQPGQRVEFRVWHDGQPQYLVARLSELTTVASR
jgi:hypothetical protein